MLAGTADQMQSAIRPIRVSWRTKGLFKLKAKSDAARPPYDVEDEDYHEYKNSKDNENHYRCGDDGDKNDHEKHGNW